MVFFFAGESVDVMVEPNSDVDEGGSLGTDVMVDPSSDIGS